jgi:hypothetical protein
MQTILDNFFANNSSKLNFQFERKEDLTADWILNKSRIPYLPLNLNDVPYQEMLAEAGSLDTLFVKHRSNDSDGWSSLCIHGITSQHTDHYAVYPEYAHLTNDTVPYDWTEIKHRCPVTVEYFKNSFPYDVYHRIRFMKLEPGGYILPHSDSPDLSLRAVNISLNNPPGCDFVFENYGIIPFKNSGSAFLVANGYQHSVWNLSNSPRYHIIVHGYAATQPYYNLVVDSYKSLIPSIFNIKNDI